MRNEYEGAAYYQARGSRSVRYYPRSHDPLRARRHRPQLPLSGAGSTSKCGIPHPEHGEVVDPDGDVFDREGAFIDPRALAGPLRLAATITS
ncbi:MAG: hypothetical protein ACREX9_17570 [Gammaproteobacteria bacterium]